ncbi:hypothetical protein D3OALGA1CA_3007 [Olavius algarvensis associated proteobacterium Delta 3]|nr:hypothetical protein D3OALGA1CA_3007 [Olavius algarvensis associated proteobacterium Delta 3]CAB5157251.1 hypothetical protein D3OALGB2SA_5187 [Olavius algarvensis associated proteobacterium Delta 3]
MIAIKTGTAKRGGPVLFFSYRGIIAIVRIAFRFLLYRLSEFRSVT